VFVPLDPRHPAARLDWIVRDAQLRHGVVDAAGARRSARRSNTRSTSHRRQAQPPTHPRSTKKMRLCIRARPLT
jgi:hypothetical protein